MTEEYDAVIWRTMSSTMLQDAVLLIGTGHIEAAQNILKHLHKLIQTAPLLDEQKRLLVSAQMFDDVMQQLTPEGEEVVKDIIKRCFAKAKEADAYDEWKRTQKDEGDLKDGDTVTT